MQQKELKKHEGNMVCFLHRIRYHDPAYTRWSRGVVSEGICYDILVEMEGKPSFPTVYLSPLRTDFIQKMSSLERKQLNALERAVLISLKSGRNHSLLMSIPLKLGQTPHAYTGQKKSL